MNDQRYILDWRGTKRGPWSIADIEARLEAGEINSLHSIHVDGKWVVLREFLEQKRTATALSRKKAQAAQSHRPAEVSPAIHQTAPSPLPAQPSHANPPAFERPAPVQPKAKGTHLWITLVSLSALLIVLAAGVGGYLVANRGSGEDTKPTPSTTDTKSEDMHGHGKLQPFSFTGKEIFPSALISTATVDWNGDEQFAEDKKTDEDAQLRKRDLPIYGDENGWLGIELDGVKKGAQVSVEIIADGFMRPSKWQGTVTAVSQDGHTLVKPKAMWDYEALMKVRQQRPINVIFSASIDGKAFPDVTETYTLKSINDCPLYITRDKAGSDVTNLSFLFAAYVNENHPRVQDILKEALGCRLVDKMDGYFSDDPKQVVLQVLAIWNALQRRGIKYSNVAATTPGDRVFSQSVRFLDQSIDANQANCVDGTVLMASVLQKLGIKSHLVLIPGHCFLAFDLATNSAALPIGLETTMLGNNELTEVKKMDLLPSQDKLKEYQDSVKTFVEAVAVGNDTIKKYARKLQNNEDARFRFVSIEDARDLGIMPIPFTMDK
jgi:hypothetical protein